MIEINPKSNTSISREYKILLKGNVFDDSLENSCPFFFFFIIDLSRHEKFYTSIIRNQERNRSMIIVHVDLCASVFISIRFINERREHCYSMLSTYIYRSLLRRHSNRTNRQHDEHVYSMM
jgi:hypothetical protein